MFSKVTTLPWCGSTTLVDSLTMFSYGSSAALSPSPLSTNLTYIPTQRLKKVFTRVAFKKTSMLLKQKLKSLHCRDRRVENTKLNWSIVIATVPQTEWLFKYSVSKLPLVVRIESLLIVVWVDTLKYTIGYSCLISLILFFVLPALVLNCWLGTWLATAL